MQCSCKNAHQYDSASGWCRDKYPDGANRIEDTATGTVTWKENAIEPARYAKKVS